MRNDIVAQKIRSKDHTIKHLLFFFFFNKTKVILTKLILTFILFLFNKKVNVWFRRYLINSLNKFGSIVYFRDNFKRIISNKIKSWQKNYKHNKN